MGLIRWPWKPLKEVPSPPPPDITAEEMVSSIEDLATRLKQLVGNDPEDPTNGHQLPPSHGS